MQGYFRSLKVVEYNLALIYKFLHYFTFLAIGIVGGNPIAHIGHKESVLCFVGLLNTLVHHIIHIYSCSYIRCNK